MPTTSQRLLFFFYKEKQIWMLTIAYDIRAARLALLNILLYYNMSPGHWIITETHVYY